MRKFLVSCVSLVLISVCLSGCADTDWEPQIIEEEIVIEGLSGEYEFLYLTDTHMIVSDKADSQQVKENAEARYNEFRSSEGVPSAEQFDEWMAYANEEELDGVLLGGDIIDYPSEANIQHMKNNLDTLEMPYIYTLGNHDWTYPWEYMTLTGAETYLPMLEEFVDGNSAVHSRDYGEFVVVAVDNSSNQINDAAMAECERIFSEGKPVIILLHVPIVTQSVLGRAKEVWSGGVVLGAGNYGGIYPNETSQKFMDMITAEDSPVEAVLAGHVHFYDKDYIDGPKKVLQIVGDGGYKGSAVRIKVRGAELTSAESTSVEPTNVKVRLTETKTDAQESEYRIEADLEKVDSDAFGQGIHDEIDREWQEFHNLTEEQRWATSHMYGHCSVSFETWEEAIEFLGIDVSNPLEAVKDMTVADSSAIPLDSEGLAGQGRHVQINWYSMEDHSIPYAHIDAGYLNGDIRVALTAMIYGEDEGEYTTGVAWAESVAFENKMLPMKNGNTALVIMPKGTGEYASMDAYFVQDNVLYSLHLVSGVLQEKELEKTLEKVLEAF